MVIDCVMLAFADAPRPALLEPGFFSKIFQNFKLSSAAAAIC
jgi:hypothetical protein